MRQTQRSQDFATGLKKKRRLSVQERHRRRDEARRTREAERRSLAVMYGMPVEPRIDPKVLAARRAEIPSEDSRDLTARILGDPNPADMRRRRLFARGPAKRRHRVTLARRVTP